MLVRLTEVVENQSTKTFSVREVTINPEHSVAIRDDYQAAQALTENRMPDGLSKSATFSRLYMNSGQHGLQIVVVGDPATVESKLNNNRRVLKG